MSDPTKLPNYQIVAIALALLDGAKKKVHTEEIAERVLLMAPDRFSWRLPQYREKGWPDKFLVKCALEDAQKRKNGYLVEGRCAAEISKDGWRLTPAGAEWVRTQSHLLRLGQQQPSSRLPKQDAQRFLKRLRSQPLYRRFVNDGSLTSSSPYDLTDMLNTSPDAPKDVIAIKFGRLRSTAELVGDRNIIRFLEACIDAFPHVLPTGEGVNEGNNEDQGRPGNRPSGG